MNKTQARVATTLVFGSWAFGLVAAYTHGIYPVEFIVALHTAAIVMLLAVSYIEVLIHD